MEPISIPENEAQELFRKYGAGFEENGKIKIHPIEALYFIERGKLNLSETFSSLMEKIKKQDELAEEKYTVLKYLRQNGYIARISFAGEPWIRVYRKGFRPGEDRTQYLLRVVHNNQYPKFEELFLDMEKARGIRKELVYAIIQYGKPVFVKCGRTSFE